ncbi:hypothetical protein L873DRAFT_1055190 [Choiromyces venosus 120613-1]|uniref:Uncharacterized protein n=1 Tax=Choiromyces venosus 120613-1 TaxID=1336337 RepID=A0A3N4JLH3_9PEZI|nr:hypothetical protein L873DRAFT_1055190 [Choiromyces venosus 120613-1]
MLLVPREGTKGDGPNVTLSNAAGRSVTRSMARSHLNPAPPPLLVLCPHLRTLVLLRPGRDPFLSFQYYTIQGLGQPSFIIISPWFQRCVWSVIITHALGGVHISIETIGNFRPHGPSLFTWFSYI